MLAESGGKLRTLSQWKILLEKSSLFMLKHLKISDTADLLVLKKIALKGESRNAIKKKHF